MPEVMYAVALAINLEPCAERRGWLLKELTAHLADDPEFDVQFGHVRLAPALPCWVHL